MEAGLEIILRPKNKCAYTYNESKRQTTHSNIICYISKGCERYVYYLNNIPIAALQIMVNPYDAIVANAFTVAAERRKGYGRQLWMEAKKSQPLLRHSMHLSEDGAHFAAHCK